MTRTSFFSLLIAIATSVTHLPSADAALPKVLILGDSISIGYTPLVVEGMKGKAVVSRPKANCGNTQAGLANLDKWIAGGPWDVIHSFSPADTCSSTVWRSSSVRGFPNSTSGGRGSTARDLCRQE